MIETVATATDIEVFLESLVTAICGIRVHDWHLDTTNLSSN